MNAPSIDIWHRDGLCFGAAGLPNRWINVQGSVDAEAGVHDLRYILNQQRSRPLPIGPTAYRLVGEGDFNVELDPDELRPGDNEITFRLVDRRGQTAETSVSLHYTPQRDCPMPYRIDWPSIDNIHTTAQVVDGRWELTPDGLRTRQIGYDRVVTLGGQSWTDVDTRVCFTVHGYSSDPMCFEMPSCGTLVGLILRWRGHVNWHDLIPYRGYRPFGVLALHVHRFKGVSRFAIYKNDDEMHPAEAPHHELALGQRVWMRATAQSQADGPSRYRLKSWYDGDPEPKTWMFDEYGTDAELPSGSIALVAHHTDATFHSIEIQPLANNR